ncbi:MAG: hypothetical protein ABIF40_04980 [archaeon]
MPTQILYQTWRGGIGLGDPKELIGYCIESPIEVLQKVFQTYAIHKFQGLSRPVDWAHPNDCLGLNITETEAPPGTLIIGNFQDLDLSRARIDYQRTEQTYRHALKKTMARHLNQKGISYLSTRDQKKIEDFESRLLLVLEVAQVTLGIEKPTVKDLQQILQGK